MQDSGGEVGPEVVALYGGTGQSGVTVLLHGVARGSKGTMERDNDEGKWRGIMAKDGAA